MADYTDYATPDKAGQLYLERLRRGSPYKYERNDASRIKCGTERLYCLLSLLFASNMLAINWDDAPPVEFALFYLTLGVLYTIVTLPDELWPNLPGSLYVLAVVARAIIQLNWTIRYEGLLFASSSWNYVRCAWSWAVLGYPVAILMLSASE